MSGGNCQAGTTEVPKARGIAPLPAEASAKKATLVMLGDSTTLCSASKPGTKLTDHIQNYLNHTLPGPVGLVNSGVDGDTVKGGFDRLQRDVLAHHPRVVTISFGLNDTGTLSPAEYRTWLEEAIQTIQTKSRARILLVTSTPFNNKCHAWGKQFSAQGGLDEYLDANICQTVRSLAEKYNLSICDQHRYFLALFTNDPHLIDSLIQPDGVHLTEKGNQVAAEHLAPMIATLLAQPETQQAK